MIVPWRGTDVRPLLLCRRAGRPQLKRDPLDGHFLRAVMNVTPSPVILVLAAAGLWILLTRGREAWDRRHDSAPRWRRQRIRFLVLVFGSTLGLTLVFVAQALHGVLWLGGLGMAFIGFSWLTYLVLSLVYGFMEGFRGE